MTLIWIVHVETYSTSVEVSARGMDCDCVRTILKQFDKAHLSVNVLIIALVVALTLNLTGRCFLG